MDGTWVQYLILSWVVVGMIGGLIASTKGHTGFRQGLILVLLGPFGVVQAIRLRKTSEAEARSAAAARRREPKPGAGCAVIIVSFLLAAVPGFFAWLMWAMRDWNEYPNKAGLQPNERAIMIGLIVGAVAIVLVGGWVAWFLRTGHWGLRPRRPSGPAAELPDPADPEGGTG